MTAEEYWNSEGIRFLNEDGTLPTVEDRVKEGYQRGWENGWNIAWETRDEMDKHRGELNNEVASLRELLNQAIEIADGLVDPFTRITGVPEQELAKLKASVALAPAPEEQNK